MSKKQHDLQKRTQIVFHPVGVVSTDLDVCAPALVAIIDGEIQEIRSGIALLNEEFQIQLKSKGLLSVYNFAFEDKLKPGPYWKKKDHGRWARLAVSSCTNKTRGLVVGKYQPEDLKNLLIKYDLLLVGFRVDLLRLRALKEALLAFL